MFTMQKKTAFSLLLTIFFELLITRTPNNSNYFRFPLKVWITGSWPSNIQCYFWKIQDDGCWHLHFIEFVTILLQTLVVHTNSSTFKLYLIAKYMKVGCTEPVECWPPTSWHLGALATVSGAISCPEPDLIIMEL